MKMFLMSYTSSAGLKNHNFSLCCYAVKEQSHLIFYSKQKWDATSQPDPQFQSNWITNKPWTWCMLIRHKTWLKHWRQVLVHGVKCAQKQIF